MSPPGSIFLELGIETQSDCAIRSIDASKPCGMKLQIRPTTEHWQQATDSSGNVFKRRPGFGGTVDNEERTRETGVCSTCSTPCTSCKARASDAQSRHSQAREHYVPTKRYLSCAYVDLPSLQTYRIGIEFPTANSGENDRFISDGLTSVSENGKNTSDASTQTDRIFNIGVDHDATTPVELLQIDEELDLRKRSTSGSSATNVTADEEARDASAPIGVHSEGVPVGHSEISGSNDYQDGERTRSSIGFAMDGTGQTQDVFEDEDLLLSSVPTADMISQAEPTLFDVTEGEEDHLLRMNAVFGAQPVIMSQPFSLMLDASQNENLNAEQITPGDQVNDDVFSFRESLDLTPEEFEQFMAMNAAFGGPAVIPPPKCLVKDYQVAPQPDPIRQPSVPTDLKVERSESFQSTINLTDSLDLSQEEYEQFIAMNAAFGGPTVIPPPRMSSKEDGSAPEETRSPVSRPLTIDLKLTTKPDSDKMPSPRSPGLSRQSAVNYLRRTDTSSSVDDDSRQNSLEVIFREDLDETAFGSEPNSDSDDDDASLVAFSEEEDGSLTPVLDNSTTFDLRVVRNPDSQSTTPTNEIKRIPKGPEFLEELFPSAPSREAYGDNAVLMRCKIDAWPPACVHWFYKDELLGDGDQAVDPDRVELTCDEIEGLYTLLLKEVEGFDTGVYTCRAGNVIGEATSSAELIVQELVSDSEYETARSYFTSGDEIVDRHPDRSWCSRGVFDGGTGKMVPKRMVRITTHGATAPRFVFKPQSRVVEIGQTARLICGVKGSPKPRVSWFREGMEIKNEGRYRVFESDEPGNFVLEIREVRPTDAGTFTCTAGNIVGQVYCSTELSVEEFGEPEVDVKMVEDEMSSLPVQYLQYGPDITNEEAVEAPPTMEEARPVIPQKLFAMEGETTKLHCPVAGHEQLTVTWYRDQKALVSTDHRVISSDGDNSLLTFLKTRLGDEGEYTCCLTEPPCTLLCCCVLVVKGTEAEPDTDDINVPASLAPLPPVSQGAIRTSSIEEETRRPDRKQTKVKHTDSLEVVNPPNLSPIFDNADSRNSGSRSLNRVGSSENANSSHGSGEGATVKWREKPPYASPRKHKENRKNRKSNRRSKHSADSNQYFFFRYDSSDSDSSSDGLARSQKEKTLSRKAKFPRKFRNSNTSDEEFDTGLERIMALSEKADTCLNIVNSVLEMTSLDKEVDEALQEQIYALQPGVRESEGNVHCPDNPGDVIIDSDTDVDFIKQMAAQTVANAIAAQMMREANSLQIEPKRTDDSPRENGFALASPATKESSKEEVGRTSENDDQDTSLNSPVHSSPICYTTSAAVQESIPSVESEIIRVDLKLNVDISHDTTPSMSPRTCLFRGPKDKIFTLDEIIDCLPETAIDENPNQSPGSTSPGDETQKFTMLGCYSHSESPNSIDESELTDDLPQEESSPEILTPLKDTFILEGDAMRLEVQIRGLPIPEVTWYRDGAELHESKNLQLKFDREDTWALIVRNIPAREGGVYTCSATNKLGSSSTSGVIAVAGLADGPDTTDVDEEECSTQERNLSPAISISSPSALDDDVFVKTNPKEVLPRILLSADETVIDDVTLGQSGDEEFQALTAHLTEALHLDRNSNWADESSPDVSRSNSNNSDKATPFHLNKRNRPDSNIEIIRHRKAFRKHPSRDSMTSLEPCSTGNSASESDTEGAPKFVRPLKTTEILEGESVQFDVCVSGEPELKVRWFHDGTELMRTDRIKCSCVENSGEKSSWRLEISNVRTIDDGRYVCKAENSVGVKSCFAFLIVEALNANDTHDADDRIVSRLLKEKEEDQSLGESSQIEEDLMKTFNVESDYSDSSGRMSVKKGDQVELLDGRSKDRWLVRHKTNSNMIGYIPCTLLKRSSFSASDKEDTKTIYNFISRQSIERRPSNSMKQKTRVNRHLSLKDTQLSELDEAKIIEDFSDTEATQSYDLYMAVASYTPTSEQKGFISMSENQVFEVLDSNSALNWLVRRGETGDVGWVPASYLTTYVSSGYNETRRGSRSLSEEEVEGLEAEEGEEGAEEVGSKEKEAMMKRGFVLKELLDTERDFVKDLRYVTTHFIPPIQHPNVPIILKGKKDVIFCNLQEIYQFHDTQFLHELEECENDANSIGRAFIKWQSTFIDLHVMYCKNKPKADTVLTPAAKAFFLQYGGGTGPGQLGLGDYLIKPVQRITKYQLLLKEIIKYTSRAKEDCQELELGLNGMIEVPKRANDLMHLNLIEGFQRDVTELGKLYRQDCFSAWSGKPKGRGKERHLFLFKDILLLAKPKKEVKGDVVGYIYKSHLMVGALNVTEDQADERRFELSQGRLAPLSLLGKTKYVKEAWVKSLRDLIAEVPKDLREGKSSSERRFDHSPIIMRKRRAASMLSSRSSMASLLEPGLNGNFSKSTESLISLISSPTLLTVPRSGRGSIDSMTGSVDLSAFTALVPSVGSMYEVLEDLVADGHETKDILKGDAVKLLEVCENNLFHIQTIPSSEGSLGMEGYVAPGLLKKMNLTEESPAFTERLRSCLVGTDDSAVLTCSFTGRPNPTAAWSLPRHLNTDNKRLEIATTEESSTLTLHRVTMLDAGEFMCTVENANGSASCSARLDVKGSQYSSLAPASFNPDNLGDIHRARSSSPLTTHSPSLDEPSLVRSSSLENLKTLDEDFDVFPGQIVRASSVSGRGMLNSCSSSSSKKSGMDKIGSFRKHFRKAFSTVGMEKDKIFANLQRSQSGSTLQKSKHQRSTTCIHCKSLKEDVGEDGHAVCEACTQRAMAGSRETLMEEEEDVAVK